MRARSAESIATIDGDVFVVEGAVLVSRVTKDSLAILRLDRGSLEEVPALQLGLPEPTQTTSMRGDSITCGSLEGIFGRFPDALWLAFSFAGRSCGSVFGISDVYRFHGGGWTLINPRIVSGGPGPIEQQSSFLISPPTWSLPRGVGFAFDNAVGDGAQGPSRFVVPLPKDAPDSVLRSARQARLTADAATVLKNDDVVVLGRETRGSTETVRIETMSARGRRSASAPVFADGFVASPPIAALDGGDFAVVARVDKPSPRWFVARVSGARATPMTLPARGTVRGLVVADGRVWTVVSTNNESLLFVGRIGEEPHPVASPDGHALQAAERLVSASGDEALVIFDEGAVRTLARVTVP